MTAGNFSRLLPAIFLLTLVGCAGMGPQPAVPPPGTGEEPAAAIRSPYDERSILLPFVRLSMIAESADYFEQFLFSDDDIFPDYIFKIFWFGYGPYEVGQGTVLRSISANGELFFQLEQSLLAIDPEGGHWWQLRYSSESADIFFEVLISDQKIPQSIRYIDPEYSLPYEHIPFIAEGYKRALQERSAEEIKTSIQEEWEKEIEQNLGFMFSKPEVLGEEPVDVGAGSYVAVHIRDHTAGQMVDYWISPDVPGQILKIEFKDAEGKMAYITELLEITSGAQSQIDEGKLIPKPSFENIVEQEQKNYEREGIPEAPVEIVLDEPYFGSVGLEGSSYYSITVERQGDLYIEVSDHSGDAELIYYGKDALFKDWTTSSQGATMNVEDYLVEAGSTVYFTIVDHADEYSYGEVYTISARQEFILDSIGILMKGDIYTQAAELSAGESLIAGLEKDGLNYYKVVVRQGPNLKIVVSGLPDYAALSWFDAVNGTFSGAVSRWDGDQRLLEIQEVTPGTVCYFYISGDARAAGPDDRFEISVSEF